MNSAELNDAIRRTDLFSGQDWRNNVGPRHYRDSACSPVFELRAMQDNGKSALEGRPIFTNKEIVTVRIKGDRNTEWCGYVTEEHRARWPEEYAAFKNGVTTAKIGTPLEHWPPLGPAQIAELKAFKIDTVEDLASITDGSLSKMGIGTRELRERARVYMETVEGGKPMARLQTENELLKAQLEAQQSQMDEIKRSMEIMMQVQAQQAQQEQPQKKSIA